jgi:hypothetical protein
MCAFPLTFAYTFQTLVEGDRPFTVGGPVRLGLSINRLHVSTKSIGVIGGGIGGVAVAVALSQAGIDAVVYERALRLREVGGRDDALAECHARAPRPGRARKPDVA